MGVTSNILTHINMGGSPKCQFMHVIIKITSSHDGVVDKPLA